MHNTRHNTHTTHALIKQDMQAKHNLYQHTPYSACMQFSVQFEFPHFSVRVIYSCPISYCNIDIFPIHQSHLQDPFLLGLKKEGDEKFQAQQYEEAAEIYTLAMDYPTFFFMDFSVIAEKLFRKRAVCFYKMVCNIALEQNRRLIT